LSPGNTAATRIAVITVKQSTNSSKQSGKPRHSRALQRATSKTKARAEVESANTNQEATALLELTT